MAWGPIAAAVGSNILSGVLDSQSTRAANATQTDIANRNIELQKEFAKNGIRWKVEDAKAAGIHPVYALGASTHSFSPISVGTMPDDSAARAVSGMGQDISRAIQATRTAEEQTLAKLQLQSAQLDLEGKAIDNQIRASQLQKIQAPGTQSFPGSQNFIPGQGNSSLYNIKPLDKTASSPSRSAQEPAWSPDVGYARTDTGLVPVPSKDIKERIEDQMVPELMWAARNYLIPNLSLGSSGQPSKDMLPKGATGWKWHYGKQEWQPYYGKEQTFRGRFGEMFRQQIYGR